MTLSHAFVSPRGLAAGLAAAGLVAAATAVPAQPYRGHERGTLLVLYERNNQCRAKVVDRLVVHRNDSVAWHVLNTCGGAARRVEIRFGASGNPLDAASLATTAADDGRMYAIRGKVQPNAAFQRYDYRIFIDGSPGPDPDLEVDPV